MISRIELQGEYSITLENDTEKKKTTLGVDGWNLMFMSKQDVIDHIALLNKALEFWVYDDEQEQSK